MGYNELKPTLYPIQKKKKPTLYQVMRKTLYKRGGEKLNHVW
jgi:hypothetical protein